MGQDPISQQLDRELGATASTATPSANSSFKMDKTGKPWDDVEIEYLRSHWISYGPTASKTWNTCSLHLHRSIEDCKAQYRLITKGRIAKKNVESKRTLVEQQSSEEYQNGREVRETYASLAGMSPTMRLIADFIAKMGDIEEWNMNKKTRSLMITFEELPK